MGCPKRGWRVRLSLESYATRGHCWPSFSSTRAPEAAPAASGAQLPQEDGAWRDRCLVEPSGLPRTLQDRGSSWPRAHSSARHQVMREGEAAARAEGRWMDWCQTGLQGDLCRKGSPRGETVPVTLLPFRLPPYLPAALIPFWGPSPAPFFLCSQLVFFFLKTLNILKFKAQWNIINTKNKTTPKTNLWLTDFCL